MPNVGETRAREGGERASEPSAQRPLFLRSIPAQQVIPTGAPNNAC